MALSVNAKKRIQSTFGLAAKEMIDIINQGLIAPSGDGGEDNTGANLGSGSQLFKAKSGVTLQFRSLVAGSNITLTQNANDVTIAAAGGGASSSGTIGGVQLSDGSGGFSADAAKLFWNNTTKQLGIGTATLVTGAVLSVAGNIDILSSNASPSYPGADFGVTITSSAVGNAVLCRYANTDLSSFLIFGSGRTGDKPARFFFNGAGGQDFEIGKSAYDATAYEAFLRVTATGETTIVGGHDLRLNGATSGYVGLKAPDAPTSVTYTLPTADGTAGSVLSTNGSGGLSWYSSARWTKYTLTYSDFADSEPIVTAVLSSIPVGMEIRRVVIRVTTSFTGGTVSSSSLTIRTASAGDLTSADAFGAVMDTANIAAGPFSGSFIDFVNVGSLEAKLETVDGDTNQLTQGSVNIYIEYGLLP